MFQTFTFINLLRLLLLSTFIIILRYIRLPQNKPNLPHINSHKKRPKASIPVENITNRNTSSRFRFEALLLRPVVSSRKLGEYRLSILFPPVIVACITPVPKREGVGNKLINELH